MTPLITALLLALSAAPQDADYPALWAAGAGYTEFHTTGDGPRDVWARNTAQAVVPDALLARARAVPGRWRLLVVASPRCSDSMGTLPGLAALAAAVEGLELRVIQRDAGEAIMRAHPAVHGRPATPTVLLLDADWALAGAWVERPRELQAALTANVDGLSHDALQGWKMRWYDHDAGASTVREVVELLESAADRGGTR